MTDLKTEIEQIVERLAERDPSINIATVTDRLLQLFEHYGDKRVREAFQTFKEALPKERSTHYSLGDPESVGALFDYQFHGEVLGYNDYRAEVLKILERESNHPSKGADHE